MPLTQFNKKYLDLETLTGQTTCRLHRKTLKKYFFLTRVGKPELLACLQLVVRFSPTGFMVSPSVHSIAFPSRCVRILGNESIL
jgi:hypothetical protein